MATPKRKTPPDDSMRGMVGADLAGLDEQLSRAWRAGTVKAFRDRADVIKGILFVAEQLLKDDLYRNA